MQALQMADALLARLEAGEYVTPPEVFSAMLALRTALSDQVDAAAERALVRGIAALSMSEEQAVRHVLAALGGPRGLVSTTAVAGEHPIARSAATNALRKLEGAGVLKSLSAGRAGTYIRMEPEAYASLLARLT